MKAIAAITALTLTALVPSSALAEMRTWTDSFGRKIQAEMIENMNGNITLLMDGGKEVQVSISSLSADDQKFVLVNSPPKIDIQVAQATDRKNQGFSFADANNSANDRDVQVQTSSTEYKITLKRSGTIPYHKPIHAEFYLIGFDKEEQAFVLLDKTVTRVDFNQEASKGTFVFNSDNVTVRNLQGGREKGTELYGNLVVLVDDQNRVFNIKGSRSKIEEHTARIRKRKEGDSVKKADLESADNRLN
ncbi:hypothetical protein PDESU_05942 [Pontiella desulfatans]|uniref:SLA1 homology domain-containing protein n=1 Tax=Pontiella desulfatans TaxID=2750659 RepID=A0A6C2UDQ9_PONDE|nr:SHD1 domain-containing protein [Pontiella desulfatans]VGO17346.1 hypothetical protein PDESU_05942 [Pontiella desulfatans]